MDEPRNFPEIGDHRDVPMALGMIVINWNHCESYLRRILIDLSTKGDVMGHRAVEPLVVEMGSVGLTQALNCLADEFPATALGIPQAIRHCTNVIERYRAYRNYYVHGIGSVTRYGIKFTKELLDSDAPFYEALVEGPFGTIYSKTAKHKSKFALDHVSREQLFTLANSLGSLSEFLQALEITIRQYFNGREFLEIEQLPPLPPLPDVLVKTVLDHPRLERAPLLVPRDPREYEDDPEQGEP